MRNKSSMRGPGGSTRYSKKGDKIRQMAMSLKPIELKKRDYPTQQEVEKYTKVVNSIDVKRSEISYALQTISDKLKT
jgi:CRP-like cAMP-binding protein